MLKTSSLRNIRKFITKNYHDKLATKGENAMDTLMGTMIGVLFLAVITASFAGIYMAYVVSSAKAGENTSRAALASKYSAAALNGLYIDSANGKASAQAAGWTVTTQGGAPLSTVVPSTNAAYANSTYAAKKSMVEGGTVKISQWGYIEKSGPDKGLVKIYTAIPKAGTANACDWTNTPEVLSSTCVVVYDVLSSIVSPPPAYKVYPDINWEASITQMPWTSAPNYYTADWRPITTSKVGTIDLTTATANPDGSRNVRFVALIKDLDAGKKISLDFRKPGENSFYGYTFTPTANTGETGKLERAVYGTLTVPAGTTTIDVYIDTNVTNPALPNDPTVQISRFFVYQAKPTP